MRNTTLVYIEHDGKYLMLNRNKKENDPNAGKWIGVGGHMEESESPEECAIREVYEETGLEPETLFYRGIITFCSDCCEGEYMHLFTAESERTETLSCEEGDLAWIERSEIENLNLWEGDRIFLEYLNENRGFFSLKLEYEGDSLTGSSVNFYEDF